MAEYCEYLWDPTRGHASTALARSIYEQEARFDKRDKKLAIKTVRAILREMPDVDLTHCTDEYITRFLLARKYRTEQAAALIAAYQAQITHRQDIFGNLTARDPALQRALRAGIPGVLPARDRKGRCVLVILASQWDPVAVPALAVQRAIFLVLEILIQDPRNQQSGFVAVVDWGGFSLRQGGALGAAALRNLIAALRGRFPARFKAIHFLSAPLYVQATLALVKPFLDEKTRNKIYLHGNNLSTLHEHLPTDILPAELGGIGPSFNPGLWAEPVIYAAMKEAELAAIEKEKEQKNLPVAEDKKSPEDNNSKDQEQSDTEYKDSLKSFTNEEISNNKERRFFRGFGGSTSSRNRDTVKNSTINVELNLMSKDTGSNRKNVSQDTEPRKTTEREDLPYENGNSNVINGNEGEDDLNNRINEIGERDDSLFLKDEKNSNVFEIVPRNRNSEDSKLDSLDNQSDKPLMRSGNSTNPSEEMNLIM